MTDIQELYFRDPLGYSKQDLEAIITDLRAKRKNFAAAVVTAKSATRKTPAPKADPSLQLDIEL